jgi:MFS family permease
MFYGWRIAAASFANLFVIIGIVYYSFPVFYAPLIVEFGWSRAEVTAGFFLSLVVIGPLFGISAGVLIDRYGTKRILLAGLVCGCVAFAGFAWMRSLAAYYFFYFLNSVAYVSAGPIANQVLISHWFMRMRGSAMGLAYLGAGVGGAVAPVLAQFLIRSAGWRAAMLAICGLIVLVLIPVTLLVVRDRPDELGLAPDGAAPAVSGAAGGPVERAWRIREALGARAFWLILTGSLLSIGAVGGVIQHLQLYLRDQRFTPEDAARVASFLLISSILGRVIMGWLADRFARKYVMLAACLMVASGVPILYDVSVPGLVYVFAFVFGFGMGADYMLIPLLVAECFGVASLGRLMGVILTSDAIAQAATPVLIGRLYDLQKTYVSGFAIVAAMAILGALAVALVPVRRAADTRLASR